MITPEFKSHTTLRQLIIQYGGLYGWDFERVARMRTADCKVYEGPLNFELENNYDDLILSHDQLKMHQYRIRSSKEFEEAMQQINQRLAAQKIIRDHEIKYERIGFASILGLLFAIPMITALFIKGGIYRKIIITYLLSWYELIF